MKEQQENNPSNVGQITFKLSSEERQTIDEMVASSGLNLSEYCRIKCLMDEDTLISQRKRIAELEKEVKISKVKLSCFKNSEVGTYDILLKLTEQQRNVLDRLYGKFSSWFLLDYFKDEVENDLNYNILYSLICIPQTGLLEGEYYNGGFSSVFECQNFEYWTTIIEEAFSEFKKNQ